MRGRADSSRGAALREEHAAELLAEAMEAYEQVEIIRMEDAILDIGIASSRYQKTYTFRNPGRRLLHVVPLSPRRPGVQFNVKVEDAEGKELVYLPQSFSLAFAKAFVKEKAMEANRLWKELFERPKGRLDLDAALSGLRAKSEAEGGRKADMEAMEKALEQCGAMLAEAERLLEDIRQERPHGFKGYREEKVEGAVKDLARLQRLQDVLQSLFAFLVTHRHNYVPFVVLRVPMGQSAAPGSEYALVRYTCPDHTRRTSRLDKARRALLGLPLTLLKVAFAALGVHMDTVRIPILSRARAVHFSLSVSSGLKVLAVACQNHFLRFRADNRDGNRFAIDAQTYYFHRRNEQLVTYFRKGGPELRCIVFSREFLSALGLYYMAIVVAIVLGFILAGHPGMAHLLSEVALPNATDILIAAMVSFSLAYVAVAHDSPKFQASLGFKVAALVLWLFVPFIVMNDIPATIAALGPEWYLLKLLVLPYNLALSHWWWLGWVGLAYICAVLGFTVWSALKPIRD